MRQPTKADDKQEGGLLTVTKLSELLTPNLARTSTHEFPS